MYKFLILPAFVIPVLMTTALLPFAAAAGDAVVTDAKARKAGGAWTVSVTVLHGDTGWDHYADAWRVLDADGHVLGTRVLAHPHENEQPFTRSLSGVAIPDGATEIWIEARDSVHGWNADRFMLTLGE